MTNESSIGPMITSILLFTFWMATGITYGGEGGYFFAGMGFFGLALVVLVLAMWRR